MMRRTCLVALAGILVAGCAPQAAFEPETIDVNSHALVIKGWTGDGKFCVELHLRSEDKATSLYSVTVVTPDGRRLDPASWKDRTPKAPTVGLGYGIGFGGGHHSEGGGLSSGLGFGVPLGGGRTNRITAVSACWKLADVGAPLTDCTLDVSIVSVVLKKAEVTTVPLAMALHLEEKCKEGAPIDEQQKGKPAKGLVREIDFTLK